MPEPSYTDLRWSGAPAAMAAALTALGWELTPSENPPTRDARVAAFGPVTQATVAGNPTWFALLRATEEVAAPEGVFAEPGPISDVTVGIFMGDARVPATIDNVQARALLAQMASRTPGAPAGRTLFDDVNDALRTQGGMAWQFWEYSNKIYRVGSPLVEAMAAAFGLTGTELDDLFINASQIQG
jgi:hypothetical protein